MKTLAHPCVVINGAFECVVGAEPVLEEVAGGFEFTEGPVWDENVEGLVFSDTPGDRLLIWSPQTGLRTYRDKAGQPDGNTIDRQGRLITCEHANRRVSRTDLEGRVATLADRYLGKKLNSPDDVVVKSDGTIWFTDPPYGIRPEQIEQPHNYLFRLDASTGRLTAMADDFDRPNGLCFSPDESRLYVGDGAVGRAHIRMFQLRPGNHLAGGEVFAAVDNGLPDGMRTDLDGRLYVACGDGVHVFDDRGLLMGKILLPQTPSNCTFGMSGRNRLFVTARTSLYSIDLNSVGTQRP